ncbi:MAG: metal-dependent hydrolase [Candidatus Methanofastidiosia archaeon]|jgi:membrane-bound metal-dependent hydrolase YbcI (DUF457 family)
MAAAFIHYLLGLGIAYIFGYRGLDMLIVGLIGVIQDMDFVTFFFHDTLNKSKFSRLFTHRGITHTFLFAGIVSAGIFVVAPILSLIFFTNFLLHIFADYVTSWGITPFLPFSKTRYSLGLMSIFDVPLIMISAGVGVSAILSVNPVYFFGLFFGYICLRYLLKNRLQYKRLVPMGTFTYAFCATGESYTAGKVDILGREETISVDKIRSHIDESVLEKVASKIKESSFSHFLEYPTYSIEDNTIVIKDARSFLFPHSSRLFTVFFDIDTESLYINTAGRKIEIH